ncbi:hypothetical protein CPLU01_14043 [Colletotrichum plurivorum]|uniref:Uncharacterized protein n=1 Tax=Colletotrichum plurivorum TaxID=2175906 RepID=A0A8H6N175_9PEZI|nr:hypothetical protein CPLU01_14043 [Colletotrichum plurivorum]
MSPLPDPGLVSAASNHGPGLSSDKQLSSGRSTVRSDKSVSARAQAPQNRTGLCRALHRELERDGTNATVSSSIADRSMLN